MARSIASPRSAALFLTALIGALLPVSAFAAEGDVKLHFTKGDLGVLAISGACGIIALLFGLVYIRNQVMSESPGSEKMQEVGAAIRDGALAYLRQQIRTMIIFVVLLAVGLFLLFRGNYGNMTALWMSICFMGGVAASYIAGYSGMLMAVNGNMRTAHAALTSYKKSLEIAFRSGGVAGMVTVGMGLIGATLILWLGGENAMRLLIGFGFGGSLAALFMRVGGGIFTKAADVGADLVGKVEAGIPEDDPRNPATIADNVGDNVGDCAGMAADIFESYEVTLVAAIVLGAATAAVFDQTTWMRLVLFALIARGIGIIASMIGIGSVRGTDDLDADPLTPIRKGFYTSAAIAAVLTAVAAFVMMGGDGKNPIQTAQLTPALQVAISELKTLASYRTQIATTANTQFGEAKSIVATVAKNTKKDPKALTLADFVKNGKPVPEAASVTQAAIARALTDDDPAKNPIKPEEVTAVDLANSPEVQKLGYQATEDDESFLSQVLPSAESQFPTAQNLAGYQELKDPMAVNDYPALNYATPASPTMPGAPGASYKTIASKYFGNGDDEYLIGRIRIVADQKIPSQPNGPQASTRHVDMTMWLAPSTKKELNDQVTQLKQRVTAMGGSGNVELVETKPVRIFNNGEKLAMAIEGPVAQPLKLFQTLSRGGDTYYTQSVEQVQKSANAPPGAVMPRPKSMDMAIVDRHVVPWWTFLLAICFGLVMAFLIEMLTDYYVSTHKRPVQEVAGVSTAGAAPMIIQGFAYGMESSVFMVFSIVIALLFPLFLFNPATYGGYILSFYGIALVGLGLLTTTGYVLAMDTFGPISDNAQGVFEMSGADKGNENGAKAVQRLDAAGNTTKALTKGFAIATAVVAAVALFHSYLEEGHLGVTGLRLDVPEIFLGLLIGAAAPYLFSAFAINAVGRASFELINEVRRQFRGDAGIMAGTSKPDYGRCVAIVTAAAQRELLGPGILAIALPAAVAFGFSIGKTPTEVDGHLYNLTGAQALGGFLAGAIVSGQLLAVLLANSGGMWDNAKKLIEDGLYGGKGSEAHKAGVVCDTVGDPFKDTAGPALNPLIKVMNLVAVLLAPVVILPLNNTILSIVTLVCVAALAASIYVSKKGSMSQAMTAATNAGTASDAHFSSHEPALEGHLETAPAETTTKRRLTVEELNKTEDTDQP